jgi:multiple sugar transport system substrate-binding protein
MNQDTYKQDLVDAMAAGQGPDILLVHSRWIPNFMDKIYPAPVEIIGEQKMKSNFVDIVVDDFLIDGSVYAAPLSVDSMALFYNKDLFNMAGITNPPKNWDEFADVARRLTKIDENGQIIQSGAAMGTAYNINRAVDVLNLLMMQKKTEMINDVRTAAVFNKRSGAGNNSYSPGEDAFRFYTQFADQNSSTVPYTWNSRMHYSVDAFSEGTLGMMFNYSWQIDSLALKSPKLNYAIALCRNFLMQMNVSIIRFTVAK